jgi:hypothetical protein
VYNSSALRVLQVLNSFMHSKIQFKQHKMEISPRFVSPKCPMFRLPFFFNALSFFFFLPFFLMFFKSLKKYIFYVFFKQISCIIKFLFMFVRLEQLQARVW